MMVVERKTAKEESELRPQADGRLWPSFSIAKIKTVHKR